MSECNRHPCAPHGFNRNASHSADEYVCDCEYWQPSEGCNAVAFQARIAVLEADRAELLEALEWLTECALNMPQDEPFDKADGVIVAAKAAIDAARKQP